MSNFLASTFASSSSDINYNKKFFEHKKQIEETSNVSLNSTSTDYIDNEPINSLFSMEELSTAISSCKNSSPGPDGIHIILIKHIPESGKKMLVSIYNYVWSSNSFPKLWRLATIIPIAKPHKDRTLPTNYKPIALTCNLCTLWEKMINRRLKWALEEKNWF